MLYNSPRGHPSHRRKKLFVTNRDYRVRFSLRFVFVFSLNIVGYFHSFLPLASLLLGAVRDEAMHHASAPTTSLRTAVVGPFPLGSRYVCQSRSVWFSSQYAYHYSWDGNKKQVWPVRKIKQHPYPPLASGGKVGNHWRHVGDASRHTCGWTPPPGMNGYQGSLLGIAGCLPV